MILWLEATGLLAASATGLAAAPMDVPQPEAREEAARLLAFWRAAGPVNWFTPDAGFDARFAAAFANLHARAAAGELTHWTRRADTALALVLLLDQYPRHAFRGTSRMYATDGMARAAADTALAAAFWEATEPDLRTFWVLPFSHSERQPDQERSVSLARRLGDPAWSNAERHRGIIYRFGRFPHRNAILGRESTPAERAYLADGGFRG